MFGCFRCPERRFGIFSLSTKFKTVKLWASLAPWKIFCLATKYLNLKMLGQTEIRYPGNGVIKSCIYLFTSARREEGSSSEVGKDRLISFPSSEYTSCVCWIILYFHMPDLFSKFCPKQFGQSHNCPSSPRDKFWTQKTKILCDVLKVGKLNAYK